MSSFLNSDVIDMIMSLSCHKESVKSEKHYLFSVLKHALYWKGEILRDANVL